MHGSRGPLVLLVAPAPSPPVLLSKLPFSTFPKASRTPDLGVSGFERAAPTAADPRDKLLSESVGGCSGNVLKMAADCVHHVALNRPAMGRSKHSVDCTMEAQASMWQW